SMATGVTLRPDGRVEGVVYRDATGAERKVRARVVVLAASAIETARLLLLSQSSRFPKGLANSSGQVGRNVVYSGAGMAQAVFHKQGRPWLAERPGSFHVQRSLQDYYQLPEPTDGVRKGGTILFNLTHANPIASVERLAAAEGAASGAKAGAKASPLWGQ